MVLGYPSSDMVLGLKSQGQDHTNDYYAYINAHLTENSNTGGFELYECLLVLGFQMTAISYQTSLQ